MDTGVKETFVIFLLLGQPSAPASLSLFIRLSVRLVLPISVLLCGISWELEIGSDVFH